jgi:hypothetical protein
VSVNYSNGLLVFDKEEGVEDIGVANEAKHVVVHVGRISNLLDDFIFPINQLQWFFTDTRNY